MKSDERGIWLLTPLIFFVFLVSKSLVSYSLLHPNFKPIEKLVSSIQDNFKKYSKNAGFQPGNFSEK